MPFPVLQSEDSCSTSSRVCRIRSGRLVQILSASALGCQGRRSLNLVRSMLWAVISNDLLVSRYVLPESPTRCDKADRIN